MEPWSAWQFFRRLIWRRNETLPIPSIVAILLRSALVASAARAVEDRQAADLLIVPPMTHIDLLDWTSFDAAIEVLRKAVALDPSSADAWGNLGQTLARSGQMREAVASSKRALSIDPNRLGLQSALLFAENYVAESDPFEMADRARAVGTLIAAKIPARTEHP